MTRAAPSVHRPGGTSFFSLSLSFPHSPCLRYSDSSRIRRLQDSAVSKRAVSSGSGSDSPPSNLCAPSLLLAHPRTPLGSCLTRLMCLVYTPVHGSWLNMMELELSVLVRQCLKRRLSEVEALRREVSAWVKERNRSGKSCGLALYH